MFGHLKPASTRCRKMLPLSALDRLLLISRTIIHACASRSQHVTRPQEVAHQLQTVMTAVQSILCALQHLCESSENPWSGLSAASAIFGDLQPCLRLADCDIFASVAEIRTFPWQLPLWRQY